MRKNVEKKLQKKARKNQSLIRDVRGLTTVEYIIILCLIAVVGFGVWQKFGTTVKTKVNDSTDEMDEILPTETETPG